MVSQCTTPCVVKKWCGFAASKRKSSLVVCDSSAQVGWRMEGKRLRSELNYFPIYSASIWVLRHKFAQGLLINVGRAVFIGSRTKKR
jgi:hypothetical protein